MIQEPAIVGLEVFATAGFLYERRAVDAIFRACTIVSLPGYSRPLIRVADYLVFLEKHTFDGRSRVR